MNDISSARIAIVGCGAMGSVYAGLLAAAGNELLVVDPWQEHIEAIRRHGLRLEGASGDRTVQVRAEMTAPGDEMDLIVIAAKSTHVGEAATQAARLVGPNTVVLTIQNGLGSADLVAQAVGTDRLLVGIAQAFGASLRGPGHAHHEAMKALRFGPVGSLPFARAEAVARLWSAAGFNVEVVPDIVAMQWEKLICNVAYSGPCALSGLTVGQVMVDADLGAISRSAASEAFGVAVARGVSLTVTDPIEHVRAFGEAVADAKPSVLLDLEQGRPSEIEFINGAVPREAAYVGLTAPVNATITGLVNARARLG